MAQDMRVPCCDLLEGDTIENITLCDWPKAHIREGAKELLLSDLAQLFAAESSIHPIKDSEETWYRTGWHHSKDFMSTMYVNVGAKAEMKIARIVRPSKLWRPSADEHFEILSKLLNGGIHFLWNRRRPYWPGGGMFLGVSVLFVRECHRNEDGTSSYSGQEVSFERKVRNCVITKEKSPSDVRELIHSSPEKDLNSLMPRARELSEDVSKYLNTAYGLVFETA